MGQVYACRVSKTLFNTQRKAAHLKLGPEMTMDAGDLLNLYHGIWKSAKEVVDVTKKIWKTPHEPALKK